MNRKQIAQLMEVLHPDQVHVEKEYRLSYSYDATGQQFLPEAVVFPRRDEEVQRLMEFSCRHQIPVVPRGAGVGFSGGSLPVQGGIVICFTRMNRILKIDPESRIARVEPGVVTHDLSRFCEEKGLFYPPDPASLKTSTIGGNVAENAGGPRCFKYGVTGNYVLALEGYLSDGQRIRAGCNALKNVAGYDLKSLLVGSEGTLAVITAIDLRLIPLPEKRILIRVDLGSLPAGARLIQSVIASGLSPSVLEFMDRTSIEAVYGYLRLERQAAHQASVLLEIDGSREEVSWKEARFAELIGDHPVVDVKIARDPEEMDRIWEVRRNISPAISRIRPQKINEDIAVPASDIPATVEYINGIARELDIPIILYGHFGDGNIHTNIMIDPADPKEKRKARTALDRIFRYVVERRGTISGEHGIGIAKKEFMPYQFSPRELDLFRRIKDVFDPDHLLNPGKIVD